MDTMEVDSSDMDGGRGLDDPEEPSTPDERMFDMDSPFLDREKDEEPIKTIRYEDTDLIRSTLTFPFSMEKKAYYLKDRFTIFQVCLKTIVR